MSTKRAPKHFQYSHPVFTRDNKLKGVYYDDSFYYFWWSYLRLNEDYRKVCESGGDGSEFYNDFGDVFNVDFRTWWRDGNRGERLFSNSPGQSFYEIKSKDDLEFGPDIVNVSFPVEMKLSLIKEKISKIIKSRGHGGRGRKSNPVSNAKYFSSRKAEIPFLRRALKVYQMKSSGEKISVIEIAESAGISQSKGAAHDEQRQLEGVDVVGSMASAVSRIFDDAETLIRNAYSRDFPGR